VNDKKICVPFDRLCDGSLDCDGGDDERFCNFKPVSKNQPEICPWVGNFTAADLTTCVKYATVVQGDTLWYDTNNTECKVGRAVQCLNSTCRKTSGGDGCSTEEGMVLFNETSNAQLYMKVTSATDVPKCFARYHCSNNGVRRPTASGSDDCTCDCGIAFLQGGSPDCSIRRSLSALDKIALIFPIGNIPAKDLETVLQAKFTDLKMDAKVSITGVQEHGSHLFNSRSRRVNSSKNTFSYFVAITASDRNEQRSLLEGLVVIKGNVFDEVSHSLNALAQKYDPSARFMGCGALDPLNVPMKSTCAANRTYCNFNFDVNSTLRLSSENAATVVVRFAGSTTSGLAVKELDSPTQPINANCIEVQDNERSVKACQTVQICSYVIDKGRQIRSASYTIVLPIENRSMHEACELTALEVRAATAQGKPSFDLAQDRHVEKNTTFVVFSIVGVVVIACLLLLIFCFGLRLYTTRHCVNEWKNLKKEVTGDPVPERTFLQWVRHKVFGQVSSRPIYNVDNKEHIESIKKMSQRWGHTFWLNFTLLGFFLVLIVVLIIGVLYYISGTTRTNFVVVVEGYHDSQCQKSPFSPTPHHLSSAEANGACNKLDSMGTSAGFVVAKALCDPVTGNITWISSRNAGECKVTPDVNSHTYKADENCLDSVSAGFGNGSSYYRLRCLSRDAEQQLRKNLTEFDTSGEPDYPKNAQHTSNPYTKEGDDRSDTNWGFFRYRTVPKLKNSSKRHRLISFEREEGWRQITKGKKEVMKQLHIYGDSPSDVPNFLGDIDIGFEFNNFFEANGTDAIRGDAASKDAMTFQGIKGTPFDIGTNKENSFTIVFWMKAKIGTKGFVWVLSDDWYSQDEMNNPLIQRLRQVMEGTQTKWFKSWRVYASLFADGESGTLRFVTASNGEVQQRVWNLGRLGIQRVFDNHWHHITLAFGTIQSQPYAQIFVDGQTSYLAEGWKICLQDSIRPIVPLERNNVFSESEIVYRTGALILGHLNAALGGFEVLSGTTAEHRDILKTVTPNMRNLYIPGSREGFVWISVAIIALFILMALWSLLVRYVGKRSKEKSAGMSHEDVKEVVERYMVTEPQVVITTLGYLQHQLMFLVSWAFPRAYKDALQSWIRVLSFDLFLFRIPVWITPVMQFLGAALFVMMFCAIDFWDHCFFRNFALHLYEDRRKRMFWKKASLDVNLGDKESLFEVLTCHTCHISTVKCVLSAKASKPEVPLQDAVEAFCASYKMSNPPTGSLSWKKDLLRAVVKQVKWTRGPSFAQVVKDVSAKQKEGKTEKECTTCKSPLIRRYHKDVNNADDRPFETICPKHNLGLRLTKIPRDDCSFMCAKYHTALTCDIKKIEGGNKWADTVHVWQCSFPGCDHYICMACGYERMPLMHTLGSMFLSKLPVLIVVVSLLLYVPVVQTTTMIIICHPVYRCVFDSCYDPLDPYFSMSLAASVGMLLFVGLLLPLQMMFASYRRRELLRETINIKSTWGYIKSGLVYGYKTITGEKITEPSDMSEIEFKHFIQLSESMGLSTMTQIYAMFRPAYMVFGPIFQQSVNLGVALCCILLETNSTEQLASTGALEMLNCLFIVICQPFSSAEVQHLSAFGSMHLVGNILLSSIYRVMLFDGNELAQTVIMGLMFGLTGSFLFYFLYTLYKLGTHKVIASQLRDIKMLINPMNFEFQPQGCDTKFFVGGRSNKPLMGFPMVSHGQNIKLTDSEVTGTVVGTDKPKGVLYWKRDDSDTWEICAKDADEFEKEYTCLQNCDSLEGTYTQYLTPEDPAEQLSKEKYVTKGERPPPRQAWSGQRRRRKGSNAQVSGGGQSVDDNSNGDAVVPLSPRLKRDSFEFMPHVGMKKIETNAQVPGGGQSVDNNSNGDAVVPLSPRSSRDSFEFMPHHGTKKIETNAQVSGGGQSVDNNSNDDAVVPL